jgi:hypothetical protein
MFPLPTHISSPLLLQHRPDPVGDVGRTQYVAMVNNAFRVYNKETGAPETAVLAIATVWQNLAVCAQSDG